ncbi:MAG: Uncharacterised protein [Synechococcus sp. CC9902]|nr:MAG: Uncharacterised protein [Synechococcus sp. CC9902]
MAVQQVHLGTVHDRAVPGSRGGPDLDQLRSAERIQRVLRVAVGLPQPGASHPAETAPAKPVIHHSVEIPSTKPGAGISPNLANDPGIGIDVPHNLSERRPEVGWNFSGNIKSPSINSPLQPMTGHRQQMLPNRWIGVVELGQIRQGPPGVITAVLTFGGIGANRPGMHMEPVAIRRR